MNRTVTQVGRIAVGMDMELAILVLAYLSGIDSVEARLKHDLHDLAGVRFVNDGHEINVKYRTTTAKIPKPSKSVNRMVELVPEEQPLPTGFIIKTYEYAHGRAEEPRQMQAVRLNPEWIRDYGAWKADVVERQVLGKDVARYYWLAWGRKVDTRLLAQIRKALETDTKPFVSIQKAQSPGSIR